MTRTLAVLLLVLSAPAAAQAPAERTIRVIGVGRATVRPDLAIATLGVHTEAESAARALEDNSSRMQALIESLKRAGVAAADLRTRSLQLSPRFSEPQPGRSEPRLTGYAADNTVEVRLRDLARVGALLDAAVRAGGNTIQGIAFEVSDPTAARRAAREAAMADAQATARQLAALAGARLGAVRSIQESASGPRPMPFGLERAQAMAVPVESGAETVDVAVDVVWLLGGEDEPTPGQSPPVNDR